MNPAPRWMMQLPATVLGLTALGLTVQAGPLRVSIDAQETHDAVTPYEYGMFIEPIGGLIARSLWAEMLDDRKFYYPIVPESLDGPAPPSVEGRPGITYRRWRPLGADDAVSMDATDAYVGAHSPSIRSGRSPRGFTQRGIGVAKGVRYEGHVVLSADAAVHVQIALLWGPDPAAGQRIEIVPGDSGWRTIPFEFTAAASSGDARFEITATGDGTLRVGAVSLMPADNIDGWRADTTSILRTLHSGI